MWLNVLGGILFGAGFSVILPENLSPSLQVIAFLAIIIGIQLQIIGNINIWRK
jgi:hypothetical protein